MKRSGPVTRNEGDSADTSMPRCSLRKSSAKVRSMSIPKCCLNSSVAVNWSTSIGSMRWVSVGSAAAAAAVTSAATHAPSPSASSKKGRTTACDAESAPRIATGARPAAFSSGHAVPFARLSER